MMNEKRLARELRSIEREQKRLDRSLDKMIGEATKYLKSKSSSFEALGTEVYAIPEVSGIKHPFVYVPKDKEILLSKGAAFGVWSLSTEDKKLFAKAVLEHWEEVKQAIDKDIESLLEEKLKDVSDDIER